MLKFKRIFLCDIDGTLLIDGDVLNCDISADINSLLDAGVVMSFITGRGLDDTKRILSKIKVKYPFSIYDGAAIMSPDGKTVLYAEIMSKEQVMLFLKQFRYNDCALVYLAENKEIKISKNIDICALPNDIIAIHLVFQRHTHNDFLRLNRLAERAKVFLNTFLTPQNPTETNIMISASTKGKATKWIAEKYSIMGQTQVIAIGNDSNDLPMFHEAHFSCSVGECSTIIRAATQFHLDKGGGEIIEFIKNFTADENEF